MARHSHWSQIRLKKGALDKKRGKIFTKHARLIEVAVRQSGPDPDGNPGLRLAIENARADNVPRENIERAIKKGLGSAANGEQMAEIVYEGYGPGGVALMIDTFTDNKNRSSQMVRTALTKHGGSLGATGCTSFMFERKGMIFVVIPAAMDTDSAELELIDAGAQDIQEGGEGEKIIYTLPNQFGEVRTLLKKKGYEVKSGELVYVPKSPMVIEDAEIARKNLALLDVLEEDEDVVNIASSMEISEAIEKEL